jgi:hypothetical protein
MAAVVRRYLQPSPTLRWHPWAPLAVAVLAAGFMLAGAAWLGFAYGRHDYGMAFSPGTQVFVAMADEERPAAMTLVQRAQRIDREVMAWVEHGRHPDRLERAFRVVDDRFYFARPVWTRHEDAVVHLARFRLAELSAGHPRWARTADWCAATAAAPGTLLPDTYERAAHDYSILLHEDIAVSRLVPAIPGGHC